MRESRWQQFDFVIVACALGLILAGVAMIHSATCGSPCAGLVPPSSYAVRQGLAALDLSRPIRPPGLRGGQARGARGTCARARRQARRPAQLPPLDDLAGDG